MLELIDCKYKDPFYAGLRVFETDVDIVNMISLVPTHRSIDVYVGQSSYNNEVGVNSQISEVNAPFWGTGGSFTELLLSNHIPIGLEEDYMGGEGGEEGTDEEEEYMGGEEGINEEEDYMGGEGGVGREY